MALFRKRPTGNPGEWYYCIRHQKVEEGPECPARDRLGPYPTPGEAAQAMDTARQRNEDWETDPRWQSAEAGGEGEPPAEDRGPSGTS
ncbi:hypothetical protein [Streptomyces sp. TP-A0874]|uniref:hypothetical protein n=1 Tax=Streptomyces sp. TP-A0874 TaxID=549819 RepID=UPI00085295CB|nr:hypothetical protein [Streptomyces sp. TP-A0874]